MLLPGASLLGGHLIKNSSKRGGEVCKAGSYLKRRSDFPRPMGEQNGGGSNRGCIASRLLLCQVSGVQRIFESPT